MNTNTEMMLSPEQEAVVITERIKDYGRAAVNAICNIGRDLRRMKIENLYTHLGYETFEDYAEKEFNLKRRQAYLYISVYEKLGEDFVQSNAQLGITKLALLAQMNAEDRAELMDAEDIDLNGMTAKQVEELVSKYKEQGEQLSMLEEENKKLTIAKNGAENIIAEKKDKEIKKLKDKLSELEASVETKEKERAQQQEEYEARIEEMKKASEKQLENADKSSFKSMFASAYKEMTGLIEFVKSAEPEDKPVFTAKVEQLLAAVEKALKEVTAE